MLTRVLTQQPTFTSLCKCSCRHDHADVDHAKANDTESYSTNTDTNKSNRTPQCNPSAVAAFQRLLLSVYELKRMIYMAPSSRI